LTAICWRAPPLISLGFRGGNSIFVFPEQLSRPARSRGPRLSRVSQPSWRLHAASGFFQSDEVAKLSGSFAPGLRFGHQGPTLSGVPSPSTLPGATQAVTPSCGLAPLQGTPPNHPARHLSMRAPLMGISCRLAHSFRRSPHTPEGPTLRVKVRIQGLSPSFRVAPPSASRVYFTPLSPFGFALQGFPLPRSRANSSLAPLPSCRSPQVGLPPPRWAGPPAHRPHSS